MHLTALIHHHLFSQSARACEECWKNPHRTKMKICFFHAKQENCQKETMQFSWQTKARETEHPSFFTGKKQHNSFSTYTHHENAKSSPFRQVLQKTTDKIQNGGNKSHRTPLAKRVRKKKKKTKCKFLKSF